MVTSTPNITFNYGCIYALVSQDLIPGQDVDAINLLEEWHTHNKLTIWISQPAKTKTLLNVEKIRYKNKMERYGRYQQWVDILKLLESFPVFGRQSKSDQVSIKGEVALGDKDEQDTFRRLEELLGIEQDMIDPDEVFEHYSQKNHLYLCKQIESLPKQQEIVRQLNDELDISICSPRHAVELLQNEFGVV